MSFILTNDIFLGDTFPYSGGGGGTGAVDSVFGRTGSVLAQSGDYDALQVSYDDTGTYLNAVTVQAGLNQLDSYAWLERISNGAQDGYRLRGVDATNKNPIGDNAIDLGLNAGIDGGAEGEQSVVFGYDNKATGVRALVGGYQNDSSSNNSFMYGALNKSTANKTMVLGEGLETSIQSSFLAGQYNDTASTARVQFGIGADTGARNNGLEIYDDGIVMAPQATMAKITAEPEDSKVLITKEYGDEIYRDNVLVGYHKIGTVINEIIPKTLGSTYKTGYIVPSTGTYRIRTVVIDTGLGSASQATSLNVRIASQPSPSNSEYGIGGGTELFNQDMLVSTGAVTAQYYQNDDVTPTTPITLTAGEMIFVEVNPNFWSLTDLNVYLIIDNISQ